MKRFLSTAFVVFVVLSLAPAASWNSQTSREQSNQRGRVRSLRVLVLSTMLAERGIGEWGFSALVEVDGKRILFDTGGRPDTVLQNARDLRIDLAGVTDVVLSHNHWDHSGGLLQLRRELSKENPNALSRTHVGQGIFWSRPRRTSNEEGVVIGGFHLFNFDDNKLDWTADKLKEFGIRSFLGAHCTGIEAVYHVRRRAGLDRQSCVVSAVGSSFIWTKASTRLTSLVSLIRHGSK